MIYEYECGICNVVVEIIKPVSEYRKPENCSRCGFKLEQLITGGSGILIKPTSWPEYNPGLGTVVKNSKHRQEVAKAKGLIEIGSENVEKMADKAKKEREQKREKEWDDL